MLRCACGGRRRAGRRANPLGAADEALGDDQALGAEWNRTTVRLTPSNGSGRADATREGTVNLSQPNWPM